MVTIDQIAEVAINQEDDLLLRGMTLTFLRENPHLSEIPRPKTDDLRIGPGERFAQFSPHCLDVSLVKIFPAAETIL